MKPITVAFPLAGRNNQSNDPNLANPGGAEIATITLAKYLKHFGVTPLFLVHNKGSSIPYLEREGFRVEHVTLPYMPKREEITPEKLKNLHKNLNDVKKLLTEENISFIHTNDANMHRTWGYYCQQLKHPHIWHERGFFSHPAIAKQWLENASKIISISNYVYNCADDYLKPKIITIDDPVILENKDEAIKKAQNFRKTLNLEKEDKLIGMVANTSARKRWDLFAKIAAKTNKKYPNYKFACVGIRSESYYQKMNKIYTLKGGNDKLLNLGYQDNILAVIAACDCMLATAKQEPMGRAPMEALYVDTPIIASNKGGHKETLKDMQDHFLSPDDEPLSYTKLIYKAVNTPQYHQEGLEQLSQKLQKKHDPLKHAKTVCDVYAQYLKTMS